MTEVGISSATADIRRRGLDPGLVAWIAVGLFAILCFLLSENHPYLIAVAPEQAVPIAAWIEVAMTWFTEHTRFVFRGVTWLLSWPLEWLRSVAR